MLLRNPDPEKRHKASEAEMHPLHPWRIARAISNLFISSLIGMVVAVFFHLIGTAVCANFFGGEADDYSTVVAVPALALFAFVAFVCFMSYWLDEDQEE
jgi:hypothetical protein